MGKKDEQGELRHAAARPYSLDPRLFDLESKSLRPLFAMRLTPEAVILTFDLPLVEKRGIRVTGTTTSVEVEAKLKEPATVRAGWTAHKSIRFLRYKSHVLLPMAVNAAGAEATFKNGLLTVRLPRVSSGSKVRIH